jgi:hypothetical protein
MNGAESKLMVTPVKYLNLSNLSNQESLSS